MDARLLLLAAVAVVGACERGDEAPAPKQSAEPAAAALAAASKPDIAHCETLPPLEDIGRERQGPLPVPHALRPILAADPDRYAVLTLGGDTLCLDTRWFERVENLRLGDKGRFLLFDWVGYEAFGHQIVDRTGAGQVIDTGVPPLRSPSGTRFASLDYSESGYGSLNAFAVWDISATRLIERARIEQLPALSDWRIDRWVGERCLELSGVAFADAPGDYGRIGEAPRRRYIAREVGSTWRVVPAPAGGCRAA